MSNKKHVFLIIAAALLLSTFAANAQEGVTPPAETPSIAPETIFPNQPLPAAQPATGQAPSGGRDYVLAEPLPVPGANAPMTSTTFLGYLQWAFPFLLSIAAILAVVMIIAGGIQYMVSAGNTSKIEEAKNRITNAILGLLLAAVSWLILYTINPDLVRFRIVVPGLERVTVTPPPEREILRNTAETINQNTDYVTRMENEAYNREHPASPETPCQTRQRIIDRRDRTMQDCIIQYPSINACAEVGGEALSLSVTARGVPARNRANSNSYNIPCRFGRTSLECQNRPVECPPQ